MMLEALPVVSRTEMVVRFANPRDDVNALEALGMDRANIPEMLDLLKTRAAPGAAERLIDASFEAWNAFGPPYGGATRFSDGTWPVCYTAIDRETAQDEIRYHRGKDLFVSRVPVTVYYNLIELSYGGPTVDLCPQCGTWPDLVEEDEAVAYPFCQNLGREARENRISGFLTRSARRTDGTNVPVFDRAALTNPQPKGVAVFVVDPATTAINVSWA